MISFLLNESSDSNISHNVIFIIIEMVIYRVIHSFASHTLTYIVVFLFLQMSFFSYIYNKMNTDTRTKYIHQLKSFFKGKIDVIMLIFFLILIVVSDQHFIGFLVTRRNSLFSGLYHELSNNLYGNIIQNNQLITMILLSSFEEVFFRGLLFTNFNKSLSVNRANWLTSLIFMLFHNTINITILFRSMILGYAFAKNNNLFLVIILHIFMNIITMASPENFQYLGGSVFVDLITSISIFFFILWEHIKNKSTNNKDKSLYKC